MKRVAMLALVLAFGISCDDSPTSPSDPNVARFTAILLPSNEVPAITNADATASGTMQLTMTVTRDSANNITGATYDFAVNYTGFPANTTLTGAHIHAGTAGNEHARRGWIALDGQRHRRGNGPGGDYQARPQQHVCNGPSRDGRPGDFQQPGGQLLQHPHHDQYRWRHSWSAREGELEELAGEVEPQEPSAIVARSARHLRHRVPASSNVQLETCPRSASRYRTSSARRQDEAARAGRPRSRHVNARRHPRIDGRWWRRGPLLLCPGHCGHEKQHRGRHQTKA